MRPILAKILLVALFCTLPLAGCADEYGEGARSDESDRFVVVTSFYPVYVATLNVAGGIDGVDIINMTKSQTGCLHDYQLTPADLKVMEQADAFVMNGAGMEAFMSDIIEQYEEMTVIDASRGIQLLQNADGSPNPHVWVSVSNAASQVENIAEQLSEADPAHADSYSLNAAAYIEELAELKTEMHGVLDQLDSRKIITFHEAFPYFADEFGLDILAVIETDPGTSPSPAEIEALIDIVTSNKIDVLFTEPQYSSKVAELIAAETGSSIYELDPFVTGEATEEAYDDYFVVMRKNLDVLQEAME